MSIKIFDDNKDPIIICSYCKEGRHSINELCPRCGFDGETHQNEDAPLRIIKLYSKISGTIYGKIEVGAIHVYSLKGASQDVDLSKISKIELMGYNLDGNYALKFHFWSKDRNVIWKFDNIEEAEERFQKFIHICTNIDFEKFYMQRQIDQHKAAFEKIQKFLKEVHPQMRQLTLDNIGKTIGPFIETD